MSVHSPLASNLFGAFQLARDAFPVVRATAQGPIEYTAGRVGKAAGSSAGSLVDAAAVAHAFASGYPSLRRARLRSGLPSPVANPASFALDSAASTIQSFLREPDFPQAVLNHSFAAQTSTGDIALLRPADCVEIWRPGATVPNYAVFVGTLFQLGHPSFMVLESSPDGFNIHDMDAEEELKHATKVALIDRFDVVEEDSPKVVHERLANLRTLLQGDGTAASLVRAYSTEAKGMAAVSYILTGHEEPHGISDFANTVAKWAETTGQRVLTVLLGAATDRLIARARDVISRRRGKVELFWSGGCPCVREVGDTFRPVVLPGLEHDANCDSLRLQNQSFVERTAEPIRLGSQDGPWYQLFLEGGRLVLEPLFANTLRGNALRAVRQRATVVDGEP